MSFSPIVNGTGLVGWEFLNRTREKQQASFEKSPLIARETARFAQQIQTVQTSEQLMENRNLLKVALGAFGLDEDLNNRAFIKQVLDSDLSDSKSLANRLADKRYLGLAKAFNFAGTGGPTFEGSQSGSDLAAKLDKLKASDDLLSDRTLLRATLQSFGLEKDIGNEYFLKQVLESDLTDAGSFANRLSDTRYVDLAKTFDFPGKGRPADTLYGFVAAFGDRIDTLSSADDLLDAPDLVTAALSVFGLEKDFANLDRPDFLRNVLESDPYDDLSFAARLDDKRYVALSKAFGFGDPDTGTSKAEKLVTLLSTRTKTVELVGDLFNDVGLTLGVMDFYNLPQGAGKIDFARRVVDSDRTDPTSLINVYPDKRYRAFANSFDFKEPSSTRTYAPGFIDSITRNYLDRQFENGVGESDPNMRIALSLDRDLAQLIKRGGSEDTQWFSVMASKPLRTVFETAFGLPTSFGTLDLDLQLAGFKERSERMFGTEKVSDYGEPEKLDQLRRRFLLYGAQQDPVGLSSGAGVLLALLSGFSV